jgi:integrase
MSVEEEIATFRERAVGRRINEETFSEYARWIKRFETFLETDEPTIGDIEAFDSMLHDPERNDYPWPEGPGPKAPDSYAYQTRIIALSAVKQWLRRQYTNTIPEKPKQIALGDPDPFDPTYLDQETVFGIIDAADEDCDCAGCMAALRLSYDAILRASELVQVERDHIDLDAGTIVVQATKGSRQAELGLDDETVSLLADHIAEYPDRDRLFHNSYGRAWRRNAWTNHFRRKHHECGTHAFGRHSPIFHLFETGNSFGEVYRRARHVSPDMTASYARKVDVDVPEWAGVER